MWPLNYNQRSVPAEGPGKLGDEWSLVSFMCFLPVVTGRNPNEMEKVGLI